MKVLFVCYGNICRSPMAEALFRQHAAGRASLEDVEVASAGVGALDGARATSWACEVMQERFNLDLDAHRATRLTPLASADLILAMDEETLRRARDVAPASRVELLGAYAGTGQQVDDPYGGCREDYELCIERINALVQAAADRLAAELAEMRTAGDGRQDARGSSR